MYKEKIEEILDRKVTNILYQVEDIIKDYRHNFLTSMDTIEQIQLLSSFDIKEYMNKIEKHLQEDEKTENKKYKCVKDLQNTEWCINEVCTIEEWRELAIGWSESDGFNETAEYLTMMSRSEVMDFISDNWQIVFEEV